MSNPHFFQLGAVSGMAHKLFSTRLNRYVGLGDMVVGPYPESPPYLPYLAVTRPGHNEVWILDFNALDPVTYPNEYINLSSHPELVVQTIDLADYSAEGPTDLCIVSESEGYYGYVAATQTSGEKKLLRFEIDQSGELSYDMTITIQENSGVGIGQYADMEVRTDQGYIYIALPQSNGVFPFKIDDLSFGDPIQCPEPVTDLEPIGLSLMPYFESTADRANQLIDLINQIPVDAFDQPSSKDEFLNDAGQVIAEISQNGGITLVNDIMDLRMYAMQHIVETVYQNLAITSIYRILILITDHYSDPDSPETYTDLIRTIVLNLPQADFTSQGMKGQLIAASVQLRTALTVHKFVELLVKRDALEQIVQGALTDLGIVDVLEHVLTRLIPVINEITVAFDDAVNIQKTLRSLIILIDDPYLIVPQGRSILLTHVDLLEQEITDLDLQQSLVRLNVLETKIDAIVVDSEVKDRLILKTTSIRTKLELF